MCWSLQLQVPWDISEYKQLSLYRLQTFLNTATKQVYDLEPKFRSPVCNKCEFYI